MFVVTHGRKRVQEEPHASDVVAKHAAFDAAFRLESAYIHHGHIRFQAVGLVEIPGSLSAKKNRLKSESSAFYLLVW